MLIEAGVGGGRKQTFEQNATVQEGMFIHLMLRASLCLVKIKTRNNTTKVSKKKNHNQGQEAKSSRENVQANYHNLNVNVILNVKCRSIDR